MVRGRVLVMVSDRVIDVVKVKVMVKNNDASLFFINPVRNQCILP